VVLHLPPDPASHAVQLLARDGAGALVAFAHLDVADPVAGGASELVVHPASRRAGLGGRVVRALLDRLVEAGSPDGGRLRVWAHGEHPGAAALATRFGFTRDRVLWRMRRGLDTPPLAAPELPDGVRLRPFVVGADEPEFLRVNNAAFDWHPEQGGWDVNQVKLREAEPWFDPEGFLLAVDAEDRLLGFHWTKVHTEGRPPFGEVYVVGISPAEQGLGLGRLLTLTGLHHLASLGLDEVILYVESDNAAAVRVYERLGFRHEDRDTDVMYAR
jgi:mycothiol synthase